MGFDSFIVGGHSLGGAIAMHAAMIDQKTQGLILFNPGIINTGVPEFSKYLNLIFPMSRISAEILDIGKIRFRYFENSGTPVFMIPGLNNINPCVF